MNKDIRLATSFKGHRKRKRLRRLLGFGSEVYLIDLWLTVAMDCPEGVLPGWNEEDIADACDWDGNPEELVSALIESHWLEKNSDGDFVLHDWCEHQGWACKAKARSDSAKKAAEIRWKKRQDAIETRLNKGSNADAMRPHCESNAECNAPSPYPSPSPSPTPLVNNTADSAESASRSPEEKIYTTKIGKKLTGKRLETFESFWRVFNLKKGKSAAADAWLKIPSLTDALVQKIIAAAEIEDTRRPALIKSGGSPKWAQGWLSERRWEDESYSEGMNNPQPRQRTLVYEVPNDE